MARLPHPGGDDNKWGDVLNDFLSQEHNTDGSQKDLPQSKVTNLQTDLAGKVPVTRTINGHSLDVDIALAAGDVAAIPTTQKGVAGGVATLDTDARLTTAQLPQTLSAIKPSTTSLPVSYTLQSSDILNGLGGFYFTRNESWTVTDENVTIPPFECQFNAPEGVNALYIMIFYGNAPATPDELFTTAASSWFLQVYPGAKGISLVEPSWGSNDNSPPTAGTYTIGYWVSGGAVGTAIPPIHELFLTLQSLGDLNIGVVPYLSGTPVTIGANGTLEAYPVARTKLALILHPQSNGLLGEPGMDNPIFYLWPNPSLGSQMIWNSGTLMQVFDSYCEKIPAGGHFGPQFLWEGDTSRPDSRYIDIALRVGLCRLDGAASLIVAYRENGAESAMTIDTWGKSDAGNGYNTLAYLDWANPVYSVGSDIHSGAPTSPWFSSTAGGMFQFFAFARVSRPYGGQPSYTVLPAVTSAPQNLSSSVNGSNVTLNWTAPAVTNGSNVVYYSVYRGTSSGAETFLHTVFSATSYVDQNVSPGTYYYQVTAFNNSYNHESPRSNEVSATV